MTYSSKLASHYLQIARTPIAAGDFAGEDVRYASEYERLEAEIGKSSSLHETGTIDWQKVQEGSEQLLTTLSKDLRAATWLTWSLYQRESFAGLQAGLGLLHYLCTKHWPELHPRKARTRIAAINWLLPRLEPALAEHVPVGEQLALFRALAEHLRGLESCLSSQLGEDAPLLLPLCRRLEDLVSRASQGQPAPGPVKAVITQAKQVASQIISGNSPIDNDKDAHKALRAQQDAARALCTWWMKHKATDLKPLRLARTLLWLPIETLPEHNAEKVTTLRGLPADRLATYKERFAQDLYADLLVDLESSIVRAPFWLDGQRLVWECLQALAAEQAMREVEIQLALFLQRAPGLEELRFHDGTPFADAETRAWISARVLPHLQVAEPEKAPAPREHGSIAPWEEALQLALLQLRKEGLKAAVQQLKQGLNHARGGRERFFWQLGLARLCLAAKKYELAKTQLEALDQVLHDSGLADWEPELTLEVLRLLHGCCELLPQNHAVRGSKEEIYRRLCHLDLEVVLD